MDPVTPKVGYVLVGYATRGFFRTVHYGFDVEDSPP
jgi:hypothetical protein